MLKTKWINFLCKLYRRYYTDPIDDMLEKIKDKKFMSKEAVYDFMVDNSIGGLHTLLKNANSLIKKGE